jgi:tetraspanin-9
MPSFLGIEKHYNASDRGGLITPSVSAIWDKIQTELQCCGVNSYEDWYDIGSWPGKRWVPQSCCRPKYNMTTELIEGSGDDLLNVNCMK